MITIDYTKLSTQMETKKKYSTINEVHAHRNPIKKSTTATDVPIEAKKRKDIRRKHRTRSWKRKTKANRIAASNALYLAKLAPTNADFEEHEHKLTIDDIRAITSLRRTRKESEFIDMSRKQYLQK